MEVLTAICPYFERERGGFTYCEACRFSFKDTAMRDKFIGSFCATFDYGKCPICHYLNDYYERKEKGFVYEERSIDRLV